VVRGSRFAGSSWGFDVRRAPGRLEWRLGLFAALAITGGQEIRRKQYFSGFFLLIS
jgi:hypothetical protein